MKYLAAFALAWLGGKNSPSVKDLESIIEAAGGKFEASKANALVEALKDKQVHELVAAGKSKLGGISGGSVSVAVSDTKAAPVTETKVEVKDEKKVEDEDAMMEGGIGLFDDEEW
jgi:large subunit ribosomal protein LP2